MVFVPTIVITTLSLLSLIKLSSPVDDLSRLVTLLYMVYYLTLDITIGLLYTPFLLGFYAMSRALCDYAGPAGTVPLAGALNFIGWFAQFVGHYGFEGKAPALTDSFLQSILAAPIVIWLDVVFAMGFMPDTKAKLLRAKVAAKARKAVSRKG